ncbi:Arf GTPase activating protein, partial [Fragilariopsis cylindrus CCMP1102]
MRKLTKLPPNKRCADCNTKLPQCVNLTVGSFICLTCSGIHREINSKIKSLGHSTFTDQEVEMMKQIGNDKVN